MAAGCRGGGGGGGSGGGGGCGGWRRAWLRVVDFGVDIGVSFCGLDAEYRLLVFRRQSSGRVRVVLPLRIVPRRRKIRRFPFSINGDGQVRLVSLLPSPSQRTYSERHVAYAYGDSNDSKYARVCRG